MSNKKTLPGDWSWLHGLTATYAIFAHDIANEGGIDQNEMDMIIQRVASWAPGEHAVVLEHMQEAFTWFAGIDHADHAEYMGELAVAIKGGLDLDDRKKVLGDLLMIASTDGTLDDDEKSMMATLAKCWSA